MRDWIKLFEGAEDDEAAQAAADEAQSQRYARESQVEAYFLKACKSLGIDFFEVRTPVYYDEDEKLVEITTSETEFSLESLEKFKTFGKVTLTINYEGSRITFKIVINDVTLPQ